VSYDPDDMLKTMFDMQREMQVNSFGADPAELIGEERKHFVTAMALAINTEVAEAMQEIAWKPWAKTDHFNREAFIEELVDMWHFVMNLALVANCDADEFFNAYANKADVNARRQREGYTGLDKQKTSGKL
jgi:dimeric dUTPase (all-alpha-NTP-PPase superfamily)